MFWAPYLRANWAPWYVSVLVIYLWDLRVLTPEKLSRFQASPLTSRLVKFWDRKYTTRGVRRPRQQGQTVSTAGVRRPRQQGSDGSDRLAVFFDFSTFRLELPLFDFPTFLMNLTLFDFSTFRLFESTRHFSTFRLFDDMYTNVYTFAIYL